MDGAAFIHLRVHSAYSLLEGAIQIKSLPGLARDSAMPAVAVTDTWNLFGALEAAETLSESGIQPITGCVFPVLPPRTDAGPGDGRGEPAGIVLLAQSETGYRNLLSLISEAYMESSGGAPGFHVDHFEGRTEGLIALSGGALGPVGTLLTDGKAELAEAMIDRLADLFPSRFYIELQRHGLAEENATEDAFIEMAYGKNLPLVATNDVYFTDARMFEAHDALICIADGSCISQDDRRRLTAEHWFKPPQMMAELFSDLPEAVANTVEIARRCHYRPVTMDKPILPNFGAEGGEGEELARQAREGLNERLAALPYPLDAAEYTDRLEFELKVIIDMGFPGYFLIVADFIKWAKNNDIPVGPGRGSGAGSVVAWALTITDLDPLRFGLLFERFLNPERVSMPDFDIDFCQDRRDEVIRYVQDKYGNDKVAQIITFGKLQARAVLRDVGRVMQLPYGHVDRLCKMVPNNPANPITLGEAIASEPRLREARDKDARVKRMLDISLKLEGLYRHASTHAAGVVIGGRPLDQLVPLYRDPRSDMPVTQFNMKWVEPAGLVKFDFLGLKTLTVLSKACEFLKKRDIDIDMLSLPLDDAPAYEMLGRGEATGVFQLESSGMRDVLRRIKPDCFEDIIALVALYRPGPMDNIPKFINCKLGEEEIASLHPMIDPLLEETYGVIVYQEQVMQIAQILAGYSLGEADLLRRAMGKKIKAEMDRQKARFVSGAVDNGVDKDAADNIFELVSKFAGYGFNKSHAAAYALVAYQTAYLKANHPVEFMAAIMTLDMGNTDKLAVFRQELQRLDIKLEMPDINRSQVEFVPNDGAIPYALGAIRNVGTGAMQMLVGEREANGPFETLADLAGRIDPRLINKRAMENLICAGALDGFDANRAKLWTGCERILGEAVRQAEDRATNQGGLFGNDDGAGGDLGLRDVENWTSMDRLNRERDALGFYLSAHPLEEYAAILNRLRVRTYRELSKAATSGSRNTTLAGTVGKVQMKRSARGNPFAFVQMSDASGSYEVTVFSEALNAHRDLLEPDSSVLLGVEAEVEAEQLRLRVNSIRSLDAVVADAAAGLRIFLRDTAPLPMIEARLPDKGRGKGRVSLVLMTGEEVQEVELDLPQPYAITPQIKASIKAVPGVIEVQEI